MSANTRGCRVLGGSVIYDGGCAYTSEWSFVKSLQSARYEEEELRVIASRSDAHEV
ncbi:MAG TPA: hypothetical protein VHC22_18440 [Pirellulales bacterium]|nr:hypothetical protein [Pirellulales bacterium]